MRKHQWLISVILIGCLVSFTGCERIRKILEPALPDPEPTEMVEPPADLPEVETTEMPDETPVGPADVLIYTGDVWWITLSDATVEAEITQNRLQSAGIQVEITEDENYVTEWMLQTTSDGSVNVLILYGVIPDTIYPAGNTQPDGSVAESWIETLDGNTILNHADYLGWSTQDGWETNAEDGWGRNREGALQNLMDIPEITMWGDNTRMTVTADGRALTPSLIDFHSDRPFRVDELEGEWFAEKVFASNTGHAQATRADPVIVRDGNRGRLAIVHQTQSEDNPKGEVAAEIIINYLIVE